jgi:hypothetical protein
MLDGKRLSRPHPEGPPDFKHAKRPFAAEISIIPGSVWQRIACAIWIVSSGFDLPIHNGALLRS